MSEQHLYSLLYITFTNGNVNNLIHGGLTFPKIAELTNKAIEQGFIILTEGKLSLSYQGLTKLKELETTYKKTNKDAWIEKEKKSIIPKLEKNFIFLPNQNELFF